MPRPLTALADAQALLLAMLAPAAPRALACAEAVGLVAAQDMRVSAPQPPRAIALRAGYALNAAELAGASAFSPAFLAAAPAHVEAGDALPDGCDCVLDADALDLSGPVAQAFAESWPGENVRRAGEDFAAGALIVAAGDRIAARHALAAARAGLTTLAVRQPRVAMIGSDDEIQSCLAHLTRAQGAEISQAGADLIVAIGGAPESAEILTHGLALEPGRDVAIGSFGETPLIVLPRQPAQALAGFIAILRPALDVLTARAKAAPVLLPLSAKISSRVGIAELAILYVQDGRFVPLAVGDMPLQALTLATHAALIAAGSEGLAAGETCAADPLDA